MKYSHTRIFIIGPQHVGKSSVAIELAKYLDCIYFDTDQMILHAVSPSSYNSIRDVYKSLGKGQFQDLEYSQYCLLPPSCLVATGGGLADNSPALEIVKKGLVILLLSKAEIVWERIIPHGLPAYISERSKDEMSQRELEEAFRSFESIFNTRMKVYTAIANITVDTINKNVTQILDELKNLDSLNNI